MPSAVASSSASETPARRSSSLNSSNNPTSAPPAKSRFTAARNSKSEGHMAGDGDGDDEDDHLQALFEASIKTYEEAAQSQGKRHFDTTEDIIRLNEHEGVPGRKIDRLAMSIAHGRPTMMQKQAPAGSAVGVYNEKGKARAIDVHIDRLQSQQALRELRDPDGKRTVQRKNREERAKTAGTGWYHLPAFPTEDRSSHGGPSSASSRYTSSSRGATAEEMKREVQAIRLRNAMDPKRFYKGGALKDKGMPAFAQLGKIIASPLEPKSVMTKAERGRTVVEELVKDAEAAAYAKRKFAEHQVKAAAGGRGHSKAKTRKPGGNKRQRR